MAITTTGSATIDYLKRELGKIGASSVNMLTDAQFNELIVGHAASTNTSTYTFQRAIGDGGTNTRFVLNGYAGVSLFTFGTSFYTETGGVSSTFTAGWLGFAPSILITAGTQSGTTIAVEALPIDVRGLMMDVIGMLEAHVSQDADSYNAGGFGLSKSGVAEKLGDLRRRYQGPFGV